MSRFIQRAATPGDERQNELRGDPASSHLRSATTAAILARLCATSATVAARSDLRPSAGFDGTTTVAPARGLGWNAKIHNTRRVASIFPFGWMTYALRSSPVADAPPAART